MGVPNPPGGSARDSAAWVHLVRRSGEGARTEQGTKRRADRPTDGRPRTRRRTELGTAPVTHIHTRADTYRDTRRYTHTRARISSRQPACPPARRRPEPALAGKCAVSLGAFVWGAGRRRAWGPSRAASQLKPPLAPRAAKPAPAPTTPPWGSRRPRTGGGVPTQGVGRALGSRLGAATTPYGARPWFRGGIGIVVPGPSLCGRGWRAAIGRIASPGSAAPRGDWKTPLACWLVNCSSRLPAFPSLHHPRTE